MRADRRTNTRITRKTPGQALAAGMINTVRRAVGCGLTVLCALALVCGFTTTAWADDVQENPQGVVVDAGMEYKVKVALDASDDAKTGVVTVTAPEGALPEGAELHAKLLSDDADTKAVADELDKAKVSYDGFTALDVCFTDADGNEVEPTEAVDVRFELPQGALGDDVDASTLAVQHLAENDEGAVEKVETVAQAAQTADAKQADGASEGQGTVEAKGDAVTAAFSVDSFSQFTFTWNEAEPAAESVASAEPRATSVSITDTILEDGCLTANATGSDSPVASYTWYRSADPEQNSNFQVVDGQTGAKINVAEDGARHYYYVEAHLQNGQTLISQPFQVEYYGSLQNGSFENPDRNEVSRNYQLQFKNATFMQIPNGTDGLIWQTTGYGGHYGGQPDGYYTEIVKENYATQRVYGVQGASDGDQFAELNCEAAGALYQDVLTVPGSTLYWGLDHSDRSGGQSSRLMVLISDTNSLPDNFDPTDVDSIEELGLQDDVVFDETTNRVGWQHESGAYTVPEGQYVTRFYFVAGNGATEGNLLDNITFSRDLPETGENQGNLVLRKNVAGIGDPAAYADETFTFNVKKQGDSGAGADYTVNAGGEWTQVVTLDAGTYVITEDQPQAIGDYQYSGTSVEGATQDSDNQLVATVEVKAKGSAIVTFTNTYTDNGGSTPGGGEDGPAHTKKIGDNDDGTYTLALDVVGKSRTETISSSKPLDIVLVLDESTSMRSSMGGGTGSRLKALKNAANNFIDATVEENRGIKDEKLQHRVAIVTFSDNADTRIGLTAVNSRNSGLLHGVVNGLHADGNTYPNEGFDEARNVLEGARDNAQKVVIFFTDGVPAGSGTNKFDQEIATDAINSAHGLKENGTLVYSIGLLNGANPDDTHSDFNEYMNAVSSNYPDATAEYEDGGWWSGVSYEVTLGSGSNRGYYKTPSTADDLNNVFQEILDETMHTTGYSNVVISDTLSEFADLIDNASFSLEITNADHKKVPVSSSSVDVAQASDAEGVNVTFTSGESKQITANVKYDEQAKTVTVDFQDDYILEDGWTYTLKFDVRPSKTAETQFTDNGGKYPVDSATESQQTEGDEGTDLYTGAESDPEGSVPNTSANKPGFYSNASATISWDGGSADYPKPVIQVTQKASANLLVQKYEETTGDNQYAEPSDPNDPNSGDKPLQGAKFQLQKDDGNNTFDGDKKKEDGSFVDPVTSHGGLLTDKKGQATFTNLEPGTYWLVETSVPAGYTKREDPIKVVVTDEGAVEVSIPSGDDGQGNPTYPDPSPATSVVGLDDTYRVAVENTGIDELPSSGSKGTVALGAAGTAAVLVAGAYLARRKGLIK